MAAHPLSIGVLGGTGAEGSGLALRFAHAGHRVAIGSRDVLRAQRTADELNLVLGRTALRGVSNESAASEAEIVVLAVPYAAQLATVLALKERLKGKILVDVTVPLVPPRVARVQLPASGSCVVSIQEQLGEGVRVVAAFQNVGAHHLRELDHEPDCDVLVASDDKDARALVCALCADAGIRGVEAGPLANAAAAEALTSVLIWINRKYKVPSAGIRITGLPAPKIR